MDSTEPKTIVSVEFKYKAPGAARPYDYAQNEELRFEVPLGTPIATVPIPAVGDTVHITLDEKGANCYKVLTRHFSYTEATGALLVSINIVVTDVDADEMGARLKQ